MNRILAYHSIDESRDDALSVRASEFERQMRYLQQRSARVVPLETYVARLRSGDPVPRDWYVLTFDDGMSDFLEHAFPIMERFGFPSTVYLIADLVGEGRNLERKGFSLLSRAQVLDLQSSGLVSFGSHTNTHRHLDGLPEAEAWREIAESKDKLEQLLGRAVTSFCYPAGKHRQVNLQQAWKAGYSSLSLTPRKGQVNYLDRQGRVLLRTGVYRQDHFGKFRVKLSWPFSRLKRAMLKFAPG